MCLLWNINVHCQTPLASFMGRGIIKIPLPPFCITCSSHLIPEGTQAGCLESRIEERHRLNEGLSSFWMISKLYQNYIFVSYFLGSIKLQGRKGKGQKIEPPGIPCQTCWHIFVKRCNKALKWLQIPFIWYVMLDCNYCISMCQILKPLALHLL